MNFYKIGQFLCRVFFRTAFRVKVEGEENIPATGPVLVCSNHISNMDPPAVGAFIQRELRFMAKEELFRFKPLGVILKSVGAFSIKRGGGDRQALKDGIKMLKEEQALMIFPEGTRSKTGELGKGMAGAGFFALRSHAVVVPCYVHGPYRLFRTVRVEFGPPIPENELYGEKLSSQELTDIIMKHIAMLKENKTQV
ncbi:lysophospholipid acyltransferase family protein [Salsuginibacillus kocurii]|uniref:lysophospholipid acyltransferase family protein n=1 Tax=Salsuginibacillus kocurii TaxID=427078 RepID=UPI0003660F54|nr:lysophospholipid acyltransferase family protein [Salsuginibacillus kocurii]